ncbi:hypothetical protein SLNWT_0508 [Streptomyces albus]|uniref:Uncharacterized protein n=1 Tax=Streptomyces albus (strain ATCC 21838 / DSM 41398 / FERM P-419 / JCM 4703 / NBRC 107858) TaxID=1081613 RepID=A0A0B5EHM8_STRA4|nr:hypothetical protein SLNWT_0508 [Streptomyces albus]AOU75198.1 hypothetical protein SLNHY_0507 [Streptomyces albus]
MPLGLGEPDSPVRVRRPAVAVPLRNEHNPTGGGAADLLPAGLRTLVRGGAAARGVISGCCRAGSALRATGGPGTCRTRSFSSLVRGPSPARPGARVRGPGGRAVAG